MEFNFPNPHELREIFEPDPVTLWRLRPGVSMGPGIEPISSMCFRGPEFKPEKRPGVVRVIALGDSVTFGAEENYPRLTAECLGAGYEMINAGVPGYSSLQGLRLFKSHLASLKPDVLIVMFGWGDHWLAHGFTDAEQTMNPPISDRPQFIEELRIYQFMHWLIAVTAASGATKDLARMRVSPDEYRQNLEEIVSEAKKGGAKVILMTPPSALSLGRLPDFLYYLKFIEGSPDEPEAVGVKRVTDLHERYNNVVRSVAQTTGAELIDLDRKWLARGMADLFRNPKKDVIHPNPEGYRLIAKTICDTIRIAR